MLIRRLGFSNVALVVAGAVALIIEGLVHAKGGLAPGAYVLAVAATAPLAWRTRAPLVALVGVEAGALKMIGLGMATAIAVDALVVRTVLVPAIMHTLGDANWRLPDWLNRRLPHLDIEGEVIEQPAQDEEEAPIAA
jgi:hypothetical protein